MTTYDRSDFQTGNLHPEVVSFYENTLNYELSSFTRWQPGFIRLSKVYKWFSERIGQINLPLNGMNHLPMTGKILPIQSEKDGRKDVQVWVRTTVTGKPIFAAAYSFHDYKGERYMNNALPLLYGNMTGILKMDRMKGNSGLTLTSLSSDSPGDEGIYYHCRWFTVKLPIHEHFRVWYDKDQNLLIATHQMYLLRIPFLKANYEINKVPIDRD